MLKQNENRHQSTKSDSPCTHHEDDTSDAAGIIYDLLHITSNGTGMTYDLADVTLNTTHIKSYITCITAGITQIILDTTSII